MKPIYSESTIILKEKYVKYIKLYGLPDDGIFKEELLNSIE